MGNKKKKNRPQPTIERQHTRYDEHQLCKTPECRNVVASWIFKFSHGYCSLCRRK